MDTDHNNAEHEMDVENEWSQEEFFEACKFLNENMCWV